MKKLSCGGLIFNSKGEFLIARPRWDSPNWNIPKGEKRPDETPRDCALREIEEETGIVPSMISFMLDLGQFEYLPGKDVHLFQITLNTEIEKPVCRSLYEEAGEWRPEMVDFKWIHFEDRGKWISKTIAKTIELARHQTETL